MLKKRVSNSILKEWLANPKKPKSGYKGDLRITLPAGLLRDYAEASAGDSGGPNARPVGISLPKTFIIDNFGNQTNAIKYYYGRGTSGGTRSTWRGLMRTHPTRGYGTKRGYT